MTTSQKIVKLCKHGPGYNMMVVEALQKYAQTIQAYLDCSSVVNIEIIKPNIIDQRLQRQFARDILQMFPVDDKIDIKPSIPLNPQNHLHCNVEPN